jgi:23S rRNA (uridine2552-2'-O)-methyltransferase
MSRSKSSSRWLNEHFKDPYVIRAQKENYRGRAVYKLIEINEQEKLIKPGMSIIDLGAAPGSWSQYSSQQLNRQGTIVAVDLLNIDALPDVEFIQGDFTETKTLEKIANLINSQNVDLILSDMAPNFSGNPAVDIPQAMHLAEITLDFACNNLKLGGNFLIKIFHGEGFDNFVKLAKKYFDVVKCKKPQASRSRSREVYLLAKNLKIRYI